MRLALDSRYTFTFYQFFSSYRTPVSILSASHHHPKSISISINIVIFVHSEVQSGNLEFSLSIVLDFSMIDSKNHSIRISLLGVLHQRVSVKLINISSHYFTQSFKIQMETNFIDSKFDMQCNKIYSSLLEIPAQTSMKVWLMLVWC